MWESDLRPDRWKDLGFFPGSFKRLSSFCCWWVLKETMARNGKLWTWIVSWLNQNLVGHSLCSWNMHWSSPLMKWSIGRRNLWSGCKFHGPWMQICDRLEGVYTNSPGGWGGSSTNHRFQIIEDLPVYQTILVWCSCIVLLETRKSHKPSGNLTVCYWKWP